MEESFMPGLFGHVDRLLELIVFLLVWFVLYECAHIVVVLLRREPLIGWGVGPYGLTLIALHEPTSFFRWLDVLFPAIVSSCMLYIGLFTSFSPVMLGKHLLLKIVIVVAGIVLTSTANLVNTMRDLRYPLWGEMRVLQTLYTLRTSWSRIHFTAFGSSYVRAHFGENPGELYQSLSF
jgi:hypothetical protein